VSSGHAGSPDQVRDHQTRGHPCARDQPPPAQRRFHAHVPHALRWCPRHLSQALMLLACCGSCAGPCCCSCACRRWHSCPEPWYRLCWCLPHPAPLPAAARSGWQPQLLLVLPKEACPACQSLFPCSCSCHCARRQHPHHRQHPRPPALLSPPQQQHTAGYLLHVPWPCCARYGHL
jgi:hypothetical protein